MFGNFQFFYLYLDYTFCRYLMIGYCCLNLLGSCVKNVMELNSLRYFQLHFG